MFKDSCGYSGNNLTANCFDLSRYRADRSQTKGVAQRFAGLPHQRLTSPTADADTCPEEGKICQRNEKPQPSPEVSSAVKIQLPSELYIEHTRFSK